MSNAAIFRDFTSTEIYRNKYRRARGMFEVWDANLHHDDIRPFACPEKKCTTTETYNTIVPTDDCPCLGFTDVRDVVQGFCDEERFHIQDGYLRRMWGCDDKCRAGLPIPSLPTIDETSTDCGCGTTAVSYVITYVDDMGVESSPSSPTNIVTRTSTATVSWDAAPDDWCITGIKLYRVVSQNLDTQAAADASEFVLVAYFEGSDGGSWTDTLDEASTGAPLTTYDPLRFPAPGNLVSVARTADGIAVADSDRIYISLPGEPQFTWEGVVEVEDTILHIEAIDNTILVLTDRYPVVIEYSLGEIMKLSRHIYSKPIPLTSLKSVSKYDGMVYFASTYSLYSWSTRAGIQDRLRPLITTEQWKNLDPTSITGTAHEYGYMFSSDTIDYSVWIEFRGDSFYTMPISYINGSVYNIDQDGIIYYLQDNAIYSWDWRREVCGIYDISDHVRMKACDQCDCCPWHLKLYLDNEGKNHFSHMRVEWDERSADHLDLSFHIHEFGRELQHEDVMEVISSRGFGIPHKYMSYESCYAYITGCGIMHEVRFATSANELTYNSLQNVEG